MKNIIFIISAVLVLGLQVTHAEEISDNSDSSVYRNGCQPDGRDKCPPNDTTMAKVMAYISDTDTCGAGNHLDIVLTDGTCYDAKSAPDVSGSKQVCNRIGTSEWFSCKKHRNYGTEIDPSEFDECNDIARGALGAAKNFAGTRGQYPCGGGEY